MAKSKTPKKLIAPCSIEDFLKFLDTGEIGTNVVWMDPSVAGEDGVLEWVIQIHVPIHHFDQTKLVSDPMIHDDMPDATWLESLSEIGQCFSLAPVTLKADDIKVYQYDFCGDKHRLKN